MKTLIEYKELLRLENDSNKLKRLENGGVDNWEWYDESLSNYKPITNINVDFLEYQHKKGDVLYYNNNRCEFECYISNEVAKVQLSLLPNFDIDTQKHCAGCMIGDSDNKIQCRCEDISNIVEEMEEITEPTYIYLDVELNRLYKKPLIIQKHEKELKIIEEKKKSIKDSLLELAKIKTEFEAKIKQQKTYLEEIDKINNI